MSKHLRSGSLRASVKSVAAVRKAFQDHIDEMPPSLSRVADWLAHNTTQVAWSRVEDIAKQVGVSPATVVRAIKQSGWQGYADLQRAVRGHLPKEPHLLELVGEQPEQPTSICSSPVRGVIDEIKRTLDLVEPAIAPVLDRLVSQLTSAASIHVVASLMTVPLAEHLALQLRLLLGHVHHIDASSSGAWLNYRDLESNDCVVGMSFPRYAKATRFFLKRSLERTSNVILITDQSGPGLPDAQLTIRLPSRSTYYYSSNVALIALIHILARTLIERDPGRVLGNINAYDEIWSQLDVLRKS
ncbi:MurR/RpiR family transcriptional regulator [bacterium]|nr:MAG: MurR/RpiR family transcriptional regulator [bacterium]